MQLCADGFDGVVGMNIDERSYGSVVDLRSNNELVMMTTTNGRCS